MPSTLGIVASGYLTRPDDITGLEFWVDASDASTITESGGSVSQWDDKSGNGRDLTQATAAAQPTTGTATMNGLNVVSFDGSDDFMLSPVLSLSQPLYIWSVFTLPVDAIVDADLVGSVSPLTVIRPHWGGVGTTALLFAGSIGLQIPKLTAGDYLWGVNFNGSSSISRLNGSEASGPAGSQGIGQFRVGRRGDGVQCLNVELGEMLIYSSSLTAQDVSNVENYLNEKWSVF